MLQNFAKYAGIIQAIVGVLGAAVPGVETAIGSGTGGNIFNILSGAVLTYLGTKGSASAQQTGAPVMAGLNGLVGILGVLGVKNLLGVELNEGTVSNLFNIAVSAWGFIATFMKKKA